MYKPRNTSVQEEFCIDALYDNKVDSHEQETASDSTSANDDSSSAAVQPFHLSHTAMSQALNVPEITYLVRQELRGFDLKNCVQVHSSWWECFAPYLWEKIFIDSDPDQGDQTVIFRNGLAAQSLSLSMYDRDVLQAMEADNQSEIMDQGNNKDRKDLTDQSNNKGVIAYVADRCRNITSLNLKLFSPLVLVKSKRTNIDHVNRGHEQEKDGEGEEESFETPVLDALFRKLPNVVELSLSFANEDLDPVLIRSVRHLPKLQTLKLFGGLRGNAFYMVKKNRKCEWPRLVEILANSCPQIENLTVGWESPSSSTPSSTTSTPQKEQQQGHQLLKLRSFHFCYAQIQNDHHLDPLFQSSPNLRLFSMDMILDPKQALDRQLTKMVKLCPRLASFKFLRPVQPSYEDVFNFQFLHSLPENATLSEIVISARGQNTQIFWDPVQVTAYQATILENMTPIFSREAGALFLDVLTLPLILTSLTLLDMQNMSLIWTALQVFPRLERLTLSGHLERSRWLDYATADMDSEVAIELALSDMQLQELESTKILACADTLQYLNLSEFEFGHGQSFATFFKVVVQRLKRLKHLHLHANHLQKAYLENTWTYEPEEGEILQHQSPHPEESIDYDSNAFNPSENFPQGSTSTDGIAGQGVGEGDDNGVDSVGNVAPSSPDIDNNNPFSYLPENYGQISLDKVFVHFEAVEFLYLQGHHSNTRLTNHNVSALVRAMPKLRVLAYDHRMDNTPPGLIKSKKDFATLTFMRMESVNSFRGVL
ncbi:hypothetical protein BGZ83_010350 [Gryganskiella cystojenkinii]|nr:hypothetical protein BGZ83_010350 [Gryganskiella cystojenkinii]